MNFAIRLLISTLSVLVTAYLLPGVDVEDFFTGLIVAIVLGCLNIFLKPILVLFALPAVIFSFGLFLIVINTFLILLADRLIDGFEVHGFWWALLFSVVLWFVTSIFNAIQSRDEEVD